MAKLPWYMKTKEMKIEDSKIKMYIELNPLYILWIKILIALRIIK